MSLSIDECIETLKRLAPTIPGPVLTAIESDLEQKEAELAAERGAGAPKAKSAYVTILLDPEHRLDGLGDFTALVVQIPEGQDAGETVPRINQAAYHQKAAAKRKTKPLTNLVEVAAHLKRRFGKEQGVNIRTKEPVRVMVADGIVQTT